MPLILFVYTTVMAIYFLPRNTEVGVAEKWLTLAGSYVIILLLWYVLRKKEQLEDKRRRELEDMKRTDREEREPGVNWWKQEMPSDEEYDTCRRNLEKVDYKVDYVLTHDAPSRFLDFTALALGESNRLHLFLDEILLKLTYEKWFFGCYHKDVQLSTKSRCVFCDVIPMGERRTGLFR